MQTDVLEENAPHDAAIILLTVHFREGNEICHGWGIVGPMCLVARAIHAHYARRAIYFNDGEYTLNGPGTLFGDRLVRWCPYVGLPVEQYWCLTLVIRDVVCVRTNHRREKFILVVPMTKYTEFARDVRAIAQTGRGPTQTWDDAYNEDSRARNAAMCAFIEDHPYFDVIRAEHFSGFYANMADERRGMRGIVRVFTR
jgi:hypothetical protein